MLWPNPQMYEKIIKPQGQKMTTWPNQMAKPDGQKSEYSGKNRAYYLLTYCENNSAYL